MTTSPSGSASDPRRDAIDAAARRIAAKYGLSGITLRRLTSEVGVAPGVVAELEPSMGALIARTFDELATSELESTSRDVDAAASPLEALRAMIPALMGDSHHTFNSIWADAWSLGRLNAPLARAARKSSEGWERMLVALISNGIDAGQFTAGVDAHLVARSFLALIDSMTAYQLIGFGTAESHADLMRRSLEHALELPPQTL